MALTMAEANARSGSTTNLPGNAGEDKNHLHQH